MIGRTPDQDALVLRFERGELSHGEFSERAIALGMDCEDVNAVGRDAWLSASDITRAA